MYSRIITINNNKSFFLFGPRATGKTTWVKKYFSKGLYLDLLEAELYNDLLANPQRLENLIPNGFSDWVVIDEIQKIPELLNEVHRLIEKCNYKFVLTGSSARKIKKQGPNLLAGRALTKSFHPLTVKELGSDFNLDFALQFGFLPSVFSESDPKAYLESYVKTYLNEEIQQEGLTRNLSAFSRFLEAASFSQGEVLNITEVSREASVDRKVVEGYFNILEDLMIAYRVPVFSKKAKRKMIAHPKFYFFDVGVFRTLRPKGPLDTPEEIQGAALETLLFQELLALNNYLKLGYSVYYWRTVTKIEVDFVLYGERGIKAFEIKRTSRMRKEMLTGLLAFKKDYPMAKCYCFYGGQRRLNIEGVEVVPVGEGIRELESLLV